MKYSIFQSLSDDKVPDLSKTMAITIYQTIQSFNPSSIHTVLRETTPSSIAVSRFKYNT